MDEHAEQVDESVGDPTFVAEDLSEVEAPAVVEEAEEVVEEPAYLVSVSVSPPTATLYVGGHGQSTKLVVAAHDNRGQFVHPVAAVFESSDPAVAEVDADGMVLGLTPGQVVITATVEDLTSSCIVTVN